MMKVIIQLDVSVDGQLPKGADLVEIFSNYLEIPHMIMSEDIDGTDDYAIEISSWELKVEEE